MFHCWNSTIKLNPLNGTENCLWGIPDDLANRRVRDPYARWCESLSLSAFADGAGYSIACWLLFFQIRKLFFVNKMCTYIFVKFLSLFKNLGC